MHQYHRMVLGVCLCGYIYILLFHKIQKYIVLCSIKDLEINNEHLQFGYLHQTRSRCVFPHKSSISIIPFVSNFFEGFVPFVPLLNRFFFFFEPNSWSILSLIFTSLMWITVLIILYKEKSITLYCKFLYCNFYGGLLTRNADTGQLGTSILPNNEWIHLVFVFDNSSSSSCANYREKTGQLNIPNYSSSVFINGKSDIEVFRVISQNTFY